MILRLLGTFAVEANAARSIAVSIRSKKARALLAYLAMKSDGRASREELATLLWGDNPDAQARHSLRQCVMSLRQDLHYFAPDLLSMSREAIQLCAQGLAVDAHEFVLLAKFAQPGELTRAADLWHGEFLADLTLDIEEFDAWRARERDRLAAAAARVFEALCENADASGDGERAIEAVERLVALDPTREDRQRTALLIHARYRGREAALDRARLLANLLRSELAISPDHATSALIEKIKNGKVALAPRRELQSAPSGSNADRPEALRDQKAPVLAAEHVPPMPMPVAKSWPNRPIAPLLALVTALSLGGAVALELATGWKLPFRMADRAHVGSSAQRADASAVVLPFAVDVARGADDLPFAQALTHDLSINLARFGDVRIVSDRTAGLYRDRHVDVAKVGAELNVRYAVVGRIERTESGRRIDVQLVDTANQTTLWSDRMQREDADPAPTTEDIARGAARVLAINIRYAEARRARSSSVASVDVRDLLVRGHVSEIRSYLGENVSDALRLYEEVLRRAPNNQAAMLGVARMNIIAAMNFVDIDPRPDVGRAERLLNEVLVKSPNWAAAHFTLGLLQKYRRQYAASLKSFERCIELNPSFLSARAQIAAILTRTGQPQKGLDLIQDTIRIAAPSDPAMGLWHLFAGEAELELGHERAALDWMLRANTLMPGSPLVHAWLASVYATIGDRPNAARYVAALKKIAPAVTQRFADRWYGNDAPNGRPQTRILQGLRLALAGPLP